MTADEQSDPEYGLVVPFVVTESYDGPLDDEAFTIGFELGQIDSEMDICAALYAIPQSRYVHTVGVEQLDLLAMRRGYLLQPGDRDDSDEWTYVEFKRHGDDDNDDE